MEKNKLFILSFFITVLFVSSCICIINYFINPRDEFTSSFFEPVIKSARNEKVKLYENYSVTPETIIIGSSRVMKLDPKYINNISNETCFNFGVNSARTEDYLAILLYLVNSNHTPDKIILGLDIEALHNNAEIDNRLIANDKLYRQISNYSKYSAVLLLIKSLNIMYLVDDLKTIKNYFTHDNKNPDYFERDGYLRYISFENQIKKNEFNLSINIKNTKSTYHRRFEKMSDLSIKRKEYLKSFIDICDNNNVELTIFITPLHSDVVNYLTNTTSYKELLSKTIEFVNSLRQIYSITFFNFENVTYFNGNNDYFYDGSHIDYRNSNYLIDYIYGES
ncbi:hypothetical protein JXM83_03065 [Candidatus Woesearchaeota archaeon]|nr:hypothetical protein [Candidatus Woesearchaeota archaeon]